MSRKREIRLQMELTLLVSWPGNGGGYQVYPDGASLITCMCAVVSDSLWPLPGSSVTKVSRQDYWSGLPFPPPRDLPHPEIEPKSPVSPALAGGFFTTEPQFNHWGSWKWERDAEVSVREMMLEKGLNSWSGFPRKAICRKRCMPRGMGHSGSWNTHEMVSTLEPRQAQSCDTSTLTQWEPFQTSDL